MLDPESPYRAYCPPGALEDAQETLDRGGHTYQSLEEHQILESSEQIILIDTTPIELPPVTFTEHWFTAAGMKRYMAEPLILHRPNLPLCPLIRSMD